MTMTLPSELGIMTETVVIVTPNRENEQKRSGGCGASAGGGCTVDADDVDCHADCHA